jgi:peptidoglycan/xylan/chitin deacetylase (PgdA/CDA1 family)
VNVDAKTGRGGRGAAAGSWLGPVESALDAAAAPVPVFVRDDDAGWGDARLLALLDVIAACGLPVDVAVIPCELDAGLARELAARDGVGLHQHGYAHVNHEREGRKCEFGPSRPAAAQRADIEAGRARLAGLLGARVDPIFTPPWNRCTAGTGHAVLAAGLRVLSREARAAPLGIPGLAELSVSVDWFAHRHGVRLSEPELGERVAAAIGSGRPVGVMFHHALMDDRELAHAGELLLLLAAHPAARPARMIELASAVAGA